MQSVAQVEDNREHPSKSVREQSAAVPGGIASGNGPTKAEAYLGPSITSVGRRSLARDLRLGQRRRSKMIRHQWNGPKGKGPHPVGSIEDFTPVR